jgi:hypothetical protein
MFKDVTAFAEHDTSFQRFHDMAISHAVWNQATTLHHISRRLILVFASPISQDLRNTFFAQGVYTIFQKPGSHLKILDARRVTRSKFYIEDSQI